ncbi:MAG: GH116 family glycosyl-hydrolase [Chloroflexota bacterium]
MTLVDGSGLRYAGDARRAVALPLGGIGTGHVALAADGSLRQWQLGNTVNHTGFVPDSFFAIRASGEEPPLDVVRTLRSRPIANAPEPAPLVTDHLEPYDPDPPTAVWPAVEATRMTVAYPFARIDVEDAGLPVSVSFEAHTPFVPLDADASGLPIIVTTFRLANRLPQRVHGFLVASLQNAVGWDGVTPITGDRCPLYGGNENHVVTLAGQPESTAILMTNRTLATTDPRAGEMLLAADRPAVPILRATSGRATLRFVESLRLLGPSVSGDWSRASVDREARSTRRPFAEPQGPSPAGSTWTGALAIPFALEAGEDTAIEVIHAWWFPNRVADFDQFGPGIPPPPTPPFLGNRYATRLGGAAQVVEAYRADADRLTAMSRAWADTLADLDAPAEVADTLAAQPSLVRSPTTFVDSEGRLLGFEGCLGASTLNWNGSVGGSCPLNCTHVWNYEQAIAALFPSLERTMRDIEWDVLQAPSGSLAHRLRVPINGPQLHDQPIGGPVEPALDGMLGAVLKTYRDARLGGGRPLLERRMPAMRRLMAHVRERWDPGGEGVLRGPQPMTYDIPLTQPNTCIGSLWIAALRALERTADALGFPGEAARYAADAATATDAYDMLLWNGRFYGRALAGDASELGAGCLADQLVGEWWAHQLDLGHLLPIDHVRTALRTIVACNLRHGFRDLQHGFRVFADGDDSGLLICTWPDGGRPAVPVRYADEVWTGTEYAVAGLCLFEGLEDEAGAILRAVRGRYDGTRRNPFNEIECGDHYSRAMAGWSLLQAWTGTSVDSIDGLIRLGGRLGRAPLLAGTAWGRVEVRARAATVEVIDGTFPLAGIVCDALATDGARPTLALDDRPVPLVAGEARGGHVVPVERVGLRAGSRLRLAW